MNVLGYEILSTKAVKKLRRKADEADTVRPALTRLEQLGGEGVRIPYYPVPPRTLYDLSLYSDTLRTIHIALRREVFRNGIEIVPEYGAKCESCGKEFEEKPEEMTCDECNGKLSEPDSQRKQAFEDWMLKVNDNNQSLKDVAETDFYDAIVMDDAFMLMLKEYHFAEDGELVDADITEVLRADPILMKIIADSTGRPGRRDDGTPMYTCTEHRNMIWTDRTNCPTCGKRLFRAYFKADNEGVGTAGGQAKSCVYYIEGEVKHKSMYNPSLTYGFSPVATAWQKVVTLMYQDSYIKDYYGKERPPRGLLFINTANVDSLTKAWDAYKAALKVDPHDVHPIPIEFGDRAGKLVEWVEFIKPLTDMQYIETRNEYRKAIGAIYGVMPLFQGDVTTSGGLNNEGLQITVTNRALELGQAYVNDLLAWVATQFGMDGWKVQLAPVEVKDEMSELVLKEKKIQNAIAMKSLGFGVSMDDEGEFEFTEQPATPAAPAALQGVGGPSPSLPSGLGFSGSPGHPEGGELEGIKAIYNEEVDRMIMLDDSLAAGFVGKALDKDALAAVKARVWKDDFEGLSAEQSDAVKTYLIKAVATKKGYAEMTTKVLEIAPALTPESAERIVKTEEHELRNALREYAYKAEIEAKPDLKFKWIGPNDARTTKCCKEISAATMGGVSMEKLKAVIQETAAANGLKAREFTPHPNCRHVFVRAF